MYIISNIILSFIKPALLRIESDSVLFILQITAMYIDGQLKGGFQTVKDYAEFCGRFKSWLEEKSLKLWPPRHGDVLAQDYRDALDYVNKEVTVFFCLNLGLNSKFSVLLLIRLRHFSWVVGIAIELNCWTLKPQTSYQFEQSHLSVSLGFMSDNWPNDQTWLAQHLRFAC